MKTVFSDGNPPLGVSGTKITAALMTALNTPSFSSQATDGHFDIAIEDVNTYGTANTRAALDAAILAAGANERILMLRTGEWPLGAVALTIPANVHLFWFPGSYFSGTADLTVNGAFFNIPTWNIFTHTGVTTFGVGVINTFFFLSLTTNSILKFDGNKIVNSQIFDNGTNVGIGMAPAQKLDVAGEIRVNASTDGASLLIFNIDRAWSFVQKSTGANTSLSLQAAINDKSFNISSPDSTAMALFIASNTLINNRAIFVPFGGRVGIGTQTPANTLEVIAQPLVDGSLFSNIQSTNYTDAYSTSPKTGIIFSNIYNSSNVTAGMGGISVGKENATDGNYASYLALHTRANGASITEKIRIDSVGNFGIGTAAPASKLHVVGDTKTEGARVLKTTRVTTTPYNVATTDHIVFVDTDGGAITVNLPAGANGRNLRIINCGAAGNNVTVTPSGAEKLFGAAASDTLADGEDENIVYETTEGWW